MLYTVVMEFASPTFLGVSLSLSIVIWCAVGGRQSLLGATFGAVLVAGTQGALSESDLFLDSWTLVMGVGFVLIGLCLPNGLAGLRMIIRDRLLRAVGRGAARPSDAERAPASVDLLADGKTAQQP